MKREQPAQNHSKGNPPAGSRGGQTSGRDPGTKVAGAPGRRGGGDHRLDDEPRLVDEKRNWVVERPGGVDEKRGLPPGWIMIEGVFSYRAAAEMRRVWGHHGWEVRLQADRMEGFYHIMVRRPLPPGTQSSRWA